MACPLRRARVPRAADRASVLGSSPAPRDTERVWQNPRLVLVSTLDVVTVNFRSERELAALLESLGGLVETKVWVVDCSGTCGDLVPPQGLDVEVIDPGTNVGFGPAVNLAVGRGRARVLLLANPDSVLDVAGVRVMLNEVATGKAVAATGIVRNLDGTVQRNTAPPPGLFQLLAEYLAGIDTRLPPAASDRDVAVIAGSVVAIGRSAFESVGGFSERFPLYVEDVELSLRLAAIGPLRQVFAEVGTHCGGRSTESDPAATFVLLHASRAQFYSDLLGRPRLVLTVVVVGLLLRAMVNRSPIRLVVAVARAGRRSYQLARLLPPRPVRNGHVQ